MPRELFLHLGAADPQANAAWSTLDGVLEAQAAKVLSGAQDLQEDIRQIVLIRILTLRDRDALPEPESDGAARAYLARALRNGYLDHVRGTRRLEPMDTSAPGDSARDAPERQFVAPAVMTSDPETLAAALFGEFDELFENGLQLEPQANRDTRLLGWMQIKQLALEPVSARQVLEGTGQLSCNASQDDFVRARNGMYKIHERVRLQLLAGLKRREESGAITPDKAAELREQIQFLKRRHTRPSRASSP